MTVSDQPRPVGWGTWDVRFHTAMVHLPTGLRVRFGLRSDDGTVVDGFTWRTGLERLGHHSVGGEYARVTVSALDTTLDLEFAGGPGDGFAASASVDGPAALVVIMDQADGFDGDVAISHGDGTVRLGDHAWRLSMSAAAVNSERPGAGELTVDARGTVWFALDPAGMAADPPQRRVDHAREQAISSRLRSSGWLEDAADAYVRSVTWNTVYAPDLGEVLTPTSRDFVCAERGGFYGRWALHTWDTFFTGLVASWIDSAYARGIFGQILTRAGTSGMLPNRVSDDRGRTDDRSQPPVGAVTVLAAYLGSGLSDSTRDRNLLASAYPSLLRWHDWWPGARRGPFGLLAWGSDPIQGDPESATVDRTRRESGLDDSPMYDEVTYDRSTRTMDLADVGLNALHAADAEALAVIAGYLDDHAAATRLRKQSADRRQAINDLLWDPASDGYRNRWTDGSFSEHVSPTLLYPLLAGAPTADQAREIATALLAPDVLGGDPPMPSTARNDPSFTARYWRGRIWAPMVYLAVAGLRRYDLDAEARAVVDPLLQLFIAEWHEHSHVRENYPVSRGEDVRALPARSDGLMSWGSLLAYLAFTAMADPRPEGWRFAHPGRTAELAGVPLGDGLLTIRADDRLTVHLDDVLLVDAPPHVVVSQYRRDADTVSGVATATGTKATIRVAVLGSAHALASVDIPVPGIPVSFRFDKETALRDQ